MEYWNSSNWNLAVQHIEQRSHSEPVPFPARNRRNVPGRIPRLKGTMEPQALPPALIRGPRSGGGSPPAAGVGIRAAVNFFLSDCTNLLKLSNHHGIIQFRLGSSGAVRRIPRKYFAVVVLLFQLCPNYITLFSTCQV